MGKGGYGRIGSNPHLCREYVVCFRENTRHANTVYYTSYICVMVHIYPKPTNITRELTPVTK